MEDKWQEWSNTILLPLVDHVPGQTSPEVEALLTLTEDQVDLALLAGDTDQTQAYVFESSRLPEIRGGSELLRHLNEVEIPRLIQARGLPGKAILYAGGGGFLAMIPYTLAEELAPEIERLYPAETGLATITCCVRRVTPAEVLQGLYGKALSLAQVQTLMLDATHGPRLAKAYGLEFGQALTEEQFQRQRGFGQLVRVMGSLLRRRKEQPQTRPFVEALPMAMRCRACQTRPAARLTTYFEEPWPLCEICHRRAQHGHRSHQIEAFLAQVKEKWPALWSQYLAGAPAEILDPQDLSELGRASQARSGYIGFIYADANRMGQLLESLLTPEDYRRFSGQLKEAIKGAAYQALAENLRPTEVDRDSPRGRSRKRVTIHPLEPLVIGGDDVMLLVPGDAALPIAARMAQLFEAAMRPAYLNQLLQQPPPDLRQPTLSVGVVIADSHNPVRILQQLAKELVASAKSHAHDQEPESVSAVDVLLLKSQSMLRRDIQQLRRMPPYYYEEGRERGRALTAAPYTLANFCRLLKLLKLIRQHNFPPSQLQSLVAALARGRQYGSTHYLYQRARLESRLGPAQAEGNLLVQLEELWPYEPGRDPIPWQQAPDKPGSFTTVLPDLLELYSLVPRPANLDTLWAEILQEDTDAHPN